MPRPTLAQADLFGTDDEDHGSAQRAAESNVMPLRRRRAMSLPDPEQAAQVLDEHDDYRVLRRLRPRPVDPGYRLRPGESIGVLVDVENPGLRPIPLEGGLLLRDRFCLALARHEDLPALTAERRWPSIAEAAGVTAALTR